MSKVKILDVVHVQNNNASCKLSPKPIQQGKCQLTPAEMEEIIRKEAERRKKKKK